MAVIVAGSKTCFLHCNPHQQIDPPCHTSLASHLNSKFKSRMGAIGWWRIQPIWRSRCNGDWEIWYLAFCTLHKGQHTSRRLEKEQQINSWYLSPCKLGPFDSLLKTWFGSNIRIFEENTFWKTITKLYQVAKSYVLFLSSG